MNSFKPFTKSEIWTEVSSLAFISSLCFAINNLPSDFIIDLPLSILKFSFTNSLGFSLSYSKTLKSIGSNLSQSGDILFYGCNIASNERGLSLISKISEIRSKISESTKRRWCR